MIAKVSVKKAYTVIVGIILVFIPGIVAYRGLPTMAMGIGMGADMAQPRALVILGTILALAVVPCIMRVFRE